MLDLSATLHTRTPQGLPTPSGILRSLASAVPSTSISRPSISFSPLDAIANALTIPPIHVDHVAEAICTAVNIGRTDVKGVVGVKEMRELIGWSQKGQRQSEAHLQQHV